jgi:hypothetical protein
LAAFVASKPASAIALARRTYRIKYRPDSGSGEKRHEIHREDAKSAKCFLAFFAPSRCNESEPWERAKLRRAMIRAVKIGCEFAWSPGLPAELSRNSVGVRHIREWKVVETLAAQLPTKKRKC